MFGGTTDQDEQQIEVLDTSLEMKVIKCDLVDLNSSN